MRKIAILVSIAVILAGCGSDVSKPENHDSSEISSSVESIIPETKSESTSPDSKAESW